MVKKTKIMVVEDDIIIRMDLVNRLQELGYTVASMASSGEEATEKARDTRPNLVLMDIKLKGKMDGVEAAEQIRTHFDIPVIYLTAYADDKTLQRAKITEPFGYIIKPFQGDELRSAIEMALYKHQIESKLRKSEELYRLVSEMTSDYYYTVSVLPDDRWIIDWIGGAFQQITGFAPGDIQDFDDWLSHLHPDDLPVIEQSMYTVLSGQPSACEYRILTKTGEERWLRDQSRPTWDPEHRRIRRIVGGVQNITGRKRASDALRRSEERYALAQRAAGIGSWDWDIPSGALHWSERIEPMFGFGPGGFGATYEAFLACVHPADRQGVIDAVNACIERGNDYSIEHRIVWPDGMVRWVLETGDVIRDESGTAIRMLGVVQDITERKLAEEALRWEVTANAILAKVSSSLLSTASIHEISNLVLDHAWHLTNSQLGYVGYIDPESGSLVTPTFLEDMQHTYQITDRDNTLKEFTRLQEWVLENRTSLLTNAPAGDPQSPGRPDGHESMHRFLAVPALIGDRLVGQIALMNAEHDYTERDLTLVERLADLYAIALQRHWAEEALQQRTLDLEARNEELDAFARTVAHDLKDPLGLIVGFAELLESDLATMSTDALEKYLGIMASHGRKLTKIVDELLLLAMVRKTDVEVIPLDMESILAEVQLHLASLIQEHQARIEQPDVWPVALGHAPWVEQVWINYLSNAIKYGGRPPHIKLGATAQADGMVKFWIQDNGPGLTPEEQSRLFVPFTQLAGGRAKGHGLGLSIVRRIVEKLGGQVGVYSDRVVGQGSVFTFTLPAVSR